MDWSEDENWETLHDRSNTDEASNHADNSGIERFTIVNFINIDGILPSSQNVGKTT